MPLATQNEFDLLLAIETQLFSNHAPGPAVLQACNLSEYPESLDKRI
jgi:hypothetical protein